MTKEPSIAERINSIIGPLNQGGNYQTAALIEEKLHSLLQAYAKEQREICSEKAELKINFDRPPTIDKFSILNAPSPNINSIKE